MSEGLFPRERAVVAPGAVHVPGWLSLARQRELVDACREWGRGPDSYRRTVLPGGGVMSVRSLCLGRRWEPYRYLDSVGVELPDWLAALGREAVAEAYGDDGGFSPDTALVNFYGAGAKMGMHQDKEERSGAPVVSLSLGDSCVFRLGNAENRGRPYRDVELVSGDLFVFGGASRWVHHGVPAVRPETADPALGLAGRLNITLRETGW
ncbi:Alkylated DNA repair protein [Streptomyces venezuelae]|uniref:alpha-ketoglutarate-dependent dioxygenase AlkB family protein n=1 Tax=Streptomyces gardneri TaxID=66892 RepID=UPI0006E2CC53|nr:alpha-ketoglutarate-dependent dioxygenase AlkB [Streptomyces gardneri]ALO10360.1 Alkylated DNA repair protein [Streptomyces venezuelae]QPK47370.1 alpha-ketoglutarate-dependent dioxygenase AlkB [Streptomyces gardneri]WRK38798.1 alpha-ketoglutarate-dependent dioxygenase AlkB [Streptomyces venezuelae]